MCKIKFQSENTSWSIHTLSNFSWICRKACNEVSYHRSLPSMDWFWTSCVISFIHMGFEWHLYLLDFKPFPCFSETSVYFRYLWANYSQSLDCFTALNSLEVFASPLHGNERQRLTRLGGTTLFVSMKLHHLLHVGNKQFILFNSLWTLFLKF